MMNKEDQDILFYAFRYALGRRTAVVSQMVGIITRKWEKISQKNKEQIQREIKHAIETGRGGDRCDIEEWYTILGL